jgi:hypothetical protein
MRRQTGIQGKDGPDEQPLPRFNFEQLCGIKFAKIAAYGSLFMYQCFRVHKYGLEATIDYLFSRVCGTEKSRSSGVDSQKHRRGDGFLSLICSYIRFVRLIFGFCPLTAYLLYFEGGIL